MTKFKVFLGIAAMLSATSANAQTSLGELLDLGGRKLSADEMKVTLIGATINGRTATGGEVEFRYNADGTVTGNAHPPLGGRIASGVYGTWKIDGEGQLCADITYSAYNTKDIRCGYLFKYGDAYFAAQSATDRATTILPRSIRH
jgi:hypothetical protein